MSAPAHPRTAAEVARARWYHAMRLPDGTVTPGEYDVEDAVRRIPFPASLAGKRCLDVGTRDGFFAFEMERRGAAEVIGIDLDDPMELDFPHPRPEIRGGLREDIERADLTFEIARGALGSRVERRPLSVYDLDPADVGEFDFAYIGTLLLHLRDPVGALAAVRSVLRPSATLLSNDPVSLALSLSRPARPAAEVLMEGPLPFWWVPNAAGRRRIVAAAGFEVIASGRPYLMRYGPGWRPAGRRDWRRLFGLVQALALRRGAPHVWVLARPAGTQRTAAA